MKKIKNILLIIFAAIAINWISDVLQSDYLVKFLYDKVVELIITLMAINIATSSIIVAKLEEIGKAKGGEFTKTIKEVQLSLIEQIALVITAIVILILYNSKVIRCNFAYHDKFFNTLVIAIFIYALDILRDTGMAIFVIIQVTKNGKATQK